MSNFQKLSETEMDIMNIIWSSDKPITSGELLEIFYEKEGKEWKGQTIATFLSRLVKKGVLELTKKGRVNYYSQRMTLEEYKQNEAQSILDKRYKGSVSNFLAALYNKKISKKEVEEIKKWFSEE